MSEKNSFRVRLMRWGDSSSSGRTVTLKLPDDTEDHPFKGLDVGSRNGQLMEMEITLLEGDAELKTLSPKPTNHPSPESQLPHKDTSVSPTMGHPPRDTTAISTSTSVDENITAATTPQTETTAVNDGNTSTDDAISSMSQLPTADPADFDSYANQMSNAAESLAAVAEEMSKAAEEDGDDDHENEDTGPPPLSRGQQAAIRAVDLCKSIDQQRAGFFYFMMARYPSVPNLETEPGNWSRDAKVTRDRVCHHCDMEGLKRLEDDTTAREMFEALETEFERHERLR